MKALCLGVTLLMAAGPDAPGPGSGPGVEAPAGKPDAAEALAKYNELREKTPETAAAQWKLALWCEQNGLPAEAYAHFASVVRLDPTREAAWRKLGYKRRDGRWMTDEQVADEAEQKKADKEWGPRLKKIHRDIHGGKKQAEAADELAAIDDPRAVPAVYREFAGGGPADQQIAVQVLGQVKSPLASKVLAVLAVYGKTPEVRQRAVLTLKGRDPDEFLPLLVNLLADPIKYEVRPIGGPGSPGVLVVEGQRFDVRRFYAPPAPDLRPRPGDIVGYDPSGLPTISRPVGREIKSGVPGSKTLVNVDRPYFRISVGDAVLQAQQGAANAQLQMQADVDRIAALNSATKEFNELVMNVAKDATGKDLGETPEDWRKAVAGGGRYSESPRKRPRKPTLDEVVPLAYLPQFGELTFLRRVVVDS